jgi:hypothetical protein
METKEIIIGHPTQQRKKEKENGSSSSRERKTTNGLGRRLIGRPKKQRGA